MKSDPSSEILQPLFTKKMNEKIYRHYNAQTTFF